MRKIVRVIAVVMFAYSGSCATDVANRYYAGDAEYPERRVDEVEVLTTAPSRTYTVLADFQARNESVSSLRRKAAKIGADAIIVTRLGGYSAVGNEWAGTDAFVGSGSRVVATAIKY